MKISFVAGDIFMKYEPKRHRDCTSTDMRKHFGLVGPGISLKIVQTAPLKSVAVFIKLPRTKSCS